MRRIILLSVACLAVVYFSTLSQNGTIFGKKLLKIKCVFWFSLQLLCETFLILRRIQRDIIINVHKSSCEVPLLLSHVNDSWILSTDFRKKYSDIKFHENRSSKSPVVPCELKTKMTKLIVGFHNFANASKVGTYLRDHILVPRCEKLKHFTHSLFRKPNEFNTILRAKCYDI
jgi:hypothetical protein